MLFLCHGEICQFNLNILASFIFPGISLHPVWVAAIILLPFIFLLVYAIRLARQYFSEEKNKQTIRTVLSHQVAPVVLDKVLLNHNANGLKGSEKDCTFLCTELNGFSRNGKAMAPDKLVELVNQFFAEMAAIIQENQGTLDRPDGNILRAFFGTPLDSQNHAVQACKTALSMQKAFEVLNEVWKEKNITGLQLRIGICSGPAVVGLIGANSNVVYSAMGESVGLSRKLMNTNKIYGSMILIGESTYLRTQEKVLTRQLDLLRIRESRTPIEIYELIALKDETLDIKTRETLEYFREGYRLYRDQNWDWAMNQFRQVLQINSEDAPARLYLFRCQEFLENPPERGWDGIYSVKSK